MKVMTFPIEGLIVAKDEDVVRVRDGYGCFYKAAI